MKNHSKHIEDLVKKSLDGYKDEVSNQVWKNLEKKLSYLNFFKFSITSFNIYYLSSLIVLGASSIIFVSNNNNSTLASKPCILISKIDSSVTKEKEATNINETPEEQKVDNSEIKSSPINNDNEEESNAEYTVKTALEKETTNLDTTANQNQETSIENQIVNSKRIIKRVSIQKKIKIHSTITQIDSVEITDKKN